MIRRGDRLLVVVSHVFRVLGMLVVPHNSVVVIRSVVAGTSSVRLAHSVPRAPHPSRSSGFDCKSKCQNETSRDDGRSSGSERWKARSVGALGDGSNQRIGSPSSSGLYPVPLGPGVCMETLYIDDLLAGK